jgi:hypothetical protein
MLVLHMHMQDKCYLEALQVWLSFFPNIDFFQIRFFKGKGIKLLFFC